MSNGPTEDRSCTDIICCLIFLAFLVGMVGVSGYGLTYGNPNLFLTMWDADGNCCGDGCGKSAGFEDYPFLYYPIIDVEELKKSLKSDAAPDPKELLAFGTCVKECPSNEGVVDCKKPSYMVNNKNFADEECVYTIYLET